MVLNTSKQAAHRKFGPKPGAKANCMAGSRGGMPRQGRRQHLSCGIRDPFGRDEAVGAHEVEVSVAEGRADG